MSLATRAQSWAERLRELRAMVRSNGEKLDAELRRWFRIEHDATWWGRFCAAADNGDELPATVWKSAEAFAGDDAGRLGWVHRLRVRNDVRRRSNRP